MIEITSTSTADIEIVIGDPSAVHLTLRCSVGNQLVANAAARELHRMMSAKLETIRCACYNQGWADKASKTTRKQTYHNLGWFRGAR